MYVINKVNSNHVIDFAAQELKKYLRMMMPRCGEIDINYAPDATDGYRLGLMSDFGLDTSEAEDLDLDDILHIDTDENGGIIAGSNPRSVLLAVYRFLTMNGCRWLFPGVDGEIIPMKKVEGVRYHKMADNRYRGHCNEGAENQEQLMEVIDFTPKIGMNIFMIEFDIPLFYYDRYYAHHGNKENREPEPITADTVLQWKRLCEVELAKRGMQLHDMGHGWTAESFGINTVNGWHKDENNPIPEEARQYVALVNGERKLWGGVALNTNFCMSNPEARRIVTKTICDYAELSTNVDYLHVWLADGNNNHCECEECQKKIASDWYVVLMNDIDAELNARGLNTRIVFCCYYDTIFPAETVKLNNPERFSILLGAITRKYTESVSFCSEPIELKKYDRNKNVWPGSIAEFVEYAKEWKRRCGVNVIVYEYYFWLHQYFDLGITQFAKIIYDDIKGYRAQGFGGIIQDCSQRSFFPNGFSFFVYGSTLFDSSVDFEALKEDYFSHAYGEDWREVLAFFEKIGKAFNYDFVAGELSADKNIGKHYNPSVAATIREVPKITEAFRPFVEAHKNMPKRSQTVLMRWLGRYLTYCDLLAPSLILKAYGAGDEAMKAYEHFRKEFGKYEIEFDKFFDHSMMHSAFAMRIFRINEVAIPGAN